MLRLLTQSTNKEGVKSSRSARTLCLLPQQLDLSSGLLHIRKDVLKGVAKDFDGGRM